MNEYTLTPDDPDVCHALFENAIDNIMGHPRPIKIKREAPVESCIQCPGPMPIRVRYCWMIQQFYSKGWDNAEYDGAQWRLVTASGKLSGNGRIEARYRENKSDQSLAVNSNDAGSLLRGFGVADNITGGRLVLEASKSGPGDTAPWRGQLAATEFRVAKAPILARLLTLASLTGISDLVTGRGIHFSRLDIPFAMQSSRLTISNARAVGSEIGISANGKIDLEGDGTRLEGTVVPAYTLNSLVGRIPLVGWILTGGEGGGIFAVDYLLSGPLDNPKIQVNPLSALAPGVLRNLLRGLAKSGTDSNQPAEPETSD